MDGIGYWLFLLLMYLLSGYKKKLQQKQKHKEIESEDGWDDDSIPFSPQVQKWFKAQVWLEEETAKSAEIIEENAPKIDAPLNKSIIDNESSEGEIAQSSEVNSKEGGLSHIGKLTKDFEEQIYHSELVDRKTVHIQKKKKTLFIQKLFSNKVQLKQSFIIKEILDKPRAYRKSIR